MNIPGLSIRRPVTVIMLILMIVLIGTVSLSRLKLDLLPDLNLPIAVATARYDGAGPREIETLVTRPFESVLSTVTNLKSIETISYDEYCLSILYFNNGTDMNFASLEMREKLDMVKPMLPDGVEDILVMRIDPNNFHSTMEIGVSSGIPLSDLTRMVEDQMINKLERLDGVASVALAGGVEQEVRIELLDERMKLYGLNEAFISRYLATENMDLPAGNFETSGKTVYLRTKGELDSINDIRDMLIASPSGGLIRLKEIASVSLNEKDKKSESYINGKPSLNISVQKQSNANTVLVCKSVNQELENLKRQFPDMNFHVVYDGSKYISKAIRTVGESALQGGVLAVLILLLFLRNIRATLIVALAIPVSIISTFVLMYFFNINLNLISLGGLALGIGMLVDNSIVVLENIYRCRYEGKSVKEAAEKGAREVMLAISASTLTSVVVFIPIVFVEGLTGKVFKEMALTITFSLLSSLLIAITFIPMISSKILKIQIPGHYVKKSLLKRFFDCWEKIYSRVLSGYRTILKKCVKSRASVISLASALLLISLISVYLIGYEYFPSMDEGYLTVEVELPKGSSIIETSNLAMEVQERLETIPEVNSIVMNLGAGGYALDRSTTEKATITVGVGDLDNRKRSIGQISDEIRKKVKDIPGAVIKLADSGNLLGLSLGGSAVDIRVFGEDIGKLKTISDDLCAIVKKIDGIRGIESSLENETEEAVIHIDRSKAAHYSLSTAQIANSVLMSVNGSLATKYKYRGSQIDVMVSLMSSGKNSVEALKNVIIDSPAGVSIPLSEIADIRMEKAPASILRNDQKRTVSLTAGISGRALNHITGDIEKAFNKYNWPAGYTYGFGGQQEELFESFDDLFLALFLAVCIVYMLLASQFESLIHPFTILLTVPLSLTGGLLSLLIAGKTLSIPSFIGIIILVGIVVNNSIVLVDCINRLRSQGMDREEAISEAGALRLRPILMTTLTTILGMVPMALESKEGSEIQSPLAVVVIGGLLVSTFITLLVLPSIYLQLDNLIIGIKNRLGKAEPLEAGAGNN